MEAQKMREDLITYIHLADEKKLEALHTLLIAEQEEEEYQWWKDEKFVAEMEEDVRKIESGEEKVYSMAEVKEFSFCINLSNSGKNTSNTTNQHLSHQAKSTK